MNTSDFQYVLPPERIASHAVEPRDSARLLVMDRRTGATTHAIFREIGRHLPPRAVIVFNDTAVIPARLLGQKPGGGKIELLLTRRISEHDAPEELWEGLARNLGTVPAGTVLAFPGGLAGEIVARLDRGAVRVRLRIDPSSSSSSSSSSPASQVPTAATVMAAVERIGAIPLPPYIEAARRRAPPAVGTPDTPATSDRDRYQTVYAAAPGAVAAPTAGLHFTRPLLAELEAAGHELVFLTLHVGPGTFRPVEAEDLREHRMEAEWYTIPPATAAAVAAARAAGRPVVAVGTTVVRALESAARAADGAGEDEGASENAGRLRPGSASSDLFLYPGAKFQVVTDLLTNFHLPRSTLLMLVAAFAGRDAVLAGYAQAIEHGYRFYSYGDAMLIRGLVVSGAFRLIAPAVSGGGGAPSGGARAGVLVTAHGEVETPVFMPVGTQASVKALSAGDVDTLGASVVLGNTYHLALRPGAEQIRALGGLHRFMGWRRAILTDSGGFQVFSLRERCTVDDDGVTFRSHLDGSPQRLTPERAMALQAALGSDVAMAFDQCPPSDAAPAVIDAAMARTTRWARRCLEAPVAPGQLRFGIVQGGVDPARRLAHMAEIAALPFDGFALGGLGVGEPAPVMHDVVAAVAPHMPASAPRYLMGVGTPVDLLAAIASGVDMFDCVMPTRNARNGQLFVRGGRLNIANARHRADPRPVEPGCPCECCARYSRAYLAHLFHARELLYYRLATIHNLQHYLDLVRNARTAILQGTFPAYRHDYLTAAPHSDLL